MAKSYEIAFKLNAKMNSAFSNTFKKAEQIAKGLGSSVENTASKMSSVLEKNPAMNKVSASLSKMGETSMKSANKLQSGYTKAFRTIENNAENTATKIIKTFSKISAVVVSGIAVKDTIEKSMSFESGMADVAKVVDGLKVDGKFTEQYDQMSKSILNMTETIPLAATELTEIMASAGQAGIASEELAIFTETAAKMSTAFDISAEQAGEWMANWRVAFKMSQNEVAVLGDKINYLGNTNAVTAGQISEIVSRIGSLGETSGLSADQIAAMGASIVGFAPEVSATSLKNFMLTLTKGSSATDTQVKAFKRLGFSATELSKRMQVDAQGAIIDILNSINKLEKHEKPALIGELFGTESVAAITQLVTNTDLLSKNLESIGNETAYTGSMQAEFAARADTTENKIQLLNNSMDKLKITVGNLFLPIVSKGAGLLSSGINKITGKINTMYENLKPKSPIIDEVAQCFVSDFSKGITKFMNGSSLNDAFSESLLSLNTILSQTFDDGVDLKIFESIKSGLDKVSGVIDTVKSAFKEIQSAYSESFGKILPEIKPLISDIFSSFNNIETDKMEIFNQAFKSFKDIVIEAAPIISSGIKLAITEVSNIAGTVSNVLSKLTPYINSAITVLQSMASAALNVASFIITNWSSIRPIAIGIASAIGMIKMVKFATDIGKATKAFALLKIAKVKDKVETLVLNGLYAKDAVVKGISTAATWAQTAAVTAWNVVSGIATIATTALGAAFTFLTSPIGLVIIAIGLVVAAGVLLYQNWETVKAYALQLWENIVSVFNNIKESVLNAINSLAEKFPGAFELITTYFDDWKENINTVIESVKTIFNNVIEFVKNVFTGKWEEAWENVKNIFSSAFNALEALATAPLNAIISLVNDVIGKINSISIPNNIPVIGGLGFDIPTLPTLGDGNKGKVQPHYATGCNYTEDTFIAGEEGPEIITNRAGSKVYDAIQTNRILNRVDSMYSSGSHGLSSVTPLRTSSNAKQTPISIQYSPQISIQGNIDDNSLEELKQALKVNSEEVRQIVMNTISEIEERGIRKSND